MNLSDHSLENAIHQTIAYADIFDYPLTVAEIHRYLIGMPATLDEVYAALHGRIACQISHCDEFITLAGREKIVHTRTQREAIAQQMWPTARYFGRIISHLPFVRMVAVTGSLAMDNVEANGDIDYLIVTEPHYLWLCRMFIVALVKYARWQTDLGLCPNYIISEDVLVFHEHSLFTARELAQMIPIAGFAIYHKMREMNTWMLDYLPNAAGLPPKYTCDDHADARYVPQSVVEMLLRTLPGKWLDRWEMRRKIRKFTTEKSDLSEAQFSPDMCKGHFEAHQQRIMQVFNARTKGKYNGR